MSQQDLNSGKSLHNAVQRRVLASIVDYQSFKFTIRLA